MSLVDEGLQTIDANTDINNRCSISTKGILCRHKEVQMLRLLNAFRNAKLKPIEKEKKYSDYERQRTQLKELNIEHHLSTWFRRDEKDPKSFDWAIIRLKKIDGTEYIVNLTTKSIVMYGISSKERQVNIGKDITYTLEGKKIIRTIADIISKDDKLTNEEKEWFYKTFPPTYIEDACRRYLHIPDEVEKRISELEKTIPERMQKLEVKFPQGIPNLHKQGNHQKFWNLLAYKPLPERDKVYLAYASIGNLIDGEENSRLVQLPKDIIELDSLCFFPNDSELRQAYYWNSESDYYKLTYSLNDVTRFVRQLLIPSLLVIKNVKTIKNL